MALLQLGVMIIGARVISGSTLPQVVTRSKNNIPARASVELVILLKRSNNLEREQNLVVRKDPPRTLPGEKQRVPANGLPCLITNGTSCDDRLGKLIGGGSQRTVPSTRTPHYRPIRTSSSRGSRTCPLWPSGQQSSPAARPADRATLRSQATRDDWMSRARGH
jgi:hypothetical protein